MNRLNKYTIVPVEEEVLNGSSNEENEEDMTNIDGLKPLHDFFSSSVDPKSSEENKRDIWQEIEYLAASNKQADKNEEGAKDRVSQNPDNSNFIFPFLNSDNSKNSEFKRDYFSLDDDDFNLLVPDNSTFPSIDSSSSDDDDGGKFFYRPGRYRLDTIQEENEEDVSSSSVQEDSTDLEGPSAVIFNSSFAASNESEGSVGFINIDRKLSMEFLKERKKKLQEKHVKRISEDSSTDEESGFQKTLLPSNSLTKRRLRSKRLLDMVPMSCSQTKPTAGMQQKNNDLLIPPNSCFSENIKPDGTNGPQSFAIKNEALNSLTNSSLMNENSNRFLTAGVDANKFREVKNKEFTNQKELDKSSVKNISQKQSLTPTQSLTTISASIKPRTETKCSALRETNPFINFERFDAREESHPNSSTDISTKKYPDHANNFRKSNDQEQLRNVNAKQAHDTTDSQTFDSWSSINEFLQRSKFSLDLPDLKHQDIFSSKSKEFSKKLPIPSNEENKSLHQSTQTSQIPSSGIVYRKYIPNSPQSTSSTQTQQSSRLANVIEQKPFLFATISSQQPDNIEFNVNHEVQNVKFNSSKVKSVDPRVELVKSKIANIKLKPPPTSIERQWDAIIHTNKPREIRIISKQNKKIYNQYTNKTQNISNSNSFHHNLNYESSRDNSSRKFKLSNDCTLHTNISNKDSARKFKSFTEKGNNQDKNVKSVIDLTRLGCRESSIRSMSESELRVWLSLQKLDIPEWYLAYPDKNKKMADLKNTRSVNDIIADIEKLSIPGERRIIGDMNLTKSVPSLVLLQEQQQRLKMPPTTSSKRWSTHLPSPYQPMHDVVNVSLPQHYRRLKWCMNDCDSDCSKENRKSLKHLKKELKFTLPSDFLKSKIAEPPFQAVVMPPFEEIMKGIDIPITNEIKGEVLSEKLVKQTIAPDMDVSIESPHIIRIRRIRNPEEVQMDKELARMPLNDENATQNCNEKPNSSEFDVAETHFPAESSGIIKSFLPQKSDDHPSSAMSYLNIPQKADQVSLPRSARSSRSFAETDFFVGRRISQHHDDRPLRLCEEINSSAIKQNYPSEHSKSLPDDSGFGSDMTPMVSNHVKRDSILSNIHKFSKSPKKEPQPTKTISNPKKFFSSGKTILNPSKAPKERTKLSSFSFGFFRASKKASTSSQKVSTTQSNSINKLNHELQRGSFAPFIEHRV